MAKLSIDLQRGLIEADGEEKFVERVYSDLKDVILGKFEEVQALPEALPDIAEGDKASNAKTPRRRAKSSGPSCASRIEALKAENFFVEAKTPKQIGNRLKEKGTTYESKNVAAALTTLTKSGKLRRFNDNGWNYQNP